MCISTRCLLLLAFLYFPLASSAVTPFAITDFGALESRGLLTGGLTGSAAAVSADGRVYIVAGGLYVLYQLFHTAFSFFLRSFKSGWSTHWNSPALFRKCITDDPSCCTHRALSNDPALWAHNDYCWGADRNYWRIHVRILVSEAGLHITFHPHSAAPPFRVHRFSMRVT